MTGRERMADALQLLGLDDGLTNVQRWLVGMTLTMELAANEPHPEAELAGWVAARLGAAEADWEAAGRWLGWALGDEPPWPPNMARS